MGVPVKASLHGRGKRACQPRSMSAGKRISALPSSADTSALRPLFSRLFAFSSRFKGRNWFLLSRPPVIPKNTLCDTGGRGTTISTMRYRVTPCSCTQRLTRYSKRVEETIRREVWTRRGEEKVKTAVISWDQPIYPSLSSSIGWLASK